MKDYKKNITFIGDIHGNVKRYQQILYKHKNNATIQVGDFGFADQWRKLETKNISAHYHKILPGNHEDYDYLNEHIVPHKLGDYGEILFHGLQFFYVRGAESIDKDWRIPHISWWEDEEIEYTKMYGAIDQYRKNTPDFMVTHTCPDVIFDTLFPYHTHRRSRTTTLLFNLFEIHRPKVWIFGHMHPVENFMKNILGTTFICLREYGTVTFDSHISIEENLDNIRKTNQCQEK